MSSRVDAARKRADEHTTQLKESAERSPEDAKGKIAEVQQKWSDHVSDVRRRIDDREAERDIELAEREAELAEDYAVSAVELAVVAIAEAEYAVLDAALTRVEADEIAEAA